MYKNLRLQIFLQCLHQSIWILGIWMKTHLVSDNNCNIVNIQAPQKLQGMTTNVVLTFSDGDTTPHFTISIEQGN